MIKSCANEAMKNQSPVIYKGQKFKRINAIIARRYLADISRSMGEIVGRPDNTQIYLELCEEKANSVTVAPCEEVELAE